MGEMAQEIWNQSLSIRNILGMSDSFKVHKEGKRKISIQANQASKQDRDRTKIANNFITEHSYVWIPNYK